MSPPQEETLLKSMRLVLHMHPAMVNSRDESTGTSLLQLVVQKCPNTKVSDHRPSLHECDHEHDHE